jgi:hypothetical protein
VRNAEHGRLGQRRWKRGSSGGACVADNGGHGHGGMRAHEQEGRGKGGCARASGMLGEALPVLDEGAGHAARHQGEWRCAAPAWQPCPVHAALRQTGGSVVVDTFEPLFSIFRVGSDLGVRNNVVAP